MGCFSWITQNSNRSIIMDGYGTRRYPCRTVYMWDNKGRRWREPNYEGYGVFGGKDYYVLMAEMNQEYGPDVTDKQKRDDGINLVYPDLNSFAAGPDPNRKKGLLFPNFTDCREWTWRNEEPDTCGNQGSGNWASCYSSDDDESSEFDDYKKRLGYKKTDKYDGWGNGETNPTK